MRVTIDGRDYVPNTETFRLTDSHFEEAAKLSNSFAAIRWAHDTQSSVAEMLAWSRVNQSEEVEQPRERGRGAKIPVPGKRDRSLFN